MRVRIFTSLFALCANFAIASSPFTEKRSKRGPSTATLQEQCCEEFGEFLNDAAHLLQSVGGVQQHAVGAVAGYAKSDKESWCYKASKPALARSKQKLASLNKKLEEVVAACEDLMTELNGS